MAIGNVLIASRLAFPRFWRIQFVLMLVILHLAAMRGAEDLWARAFMLAHFGLFIMWQPFMRAEVPLRPPQTAAILAIAVVLLWMLNWWLMSLWVSVLAGIVAGKVFLFQARWLRRFYLVVLLYLVALLLVWLVPSAFLVGRLPWELQTLAEYGLPALFLVMLVIPVETDSAETPQVIDFFYAALIFLVLVVLSLGAFAFMNVADLAYGPALIYSLLIIAAVLTLLSIAWNPRAGFAGLSMYFSRYLASIGLPFEQWLYFLAELAQVETRPERFLSEACAGIARLSWVSGGSWRSPSESGVFGTPSKNLVEFTGQQIHLRIYTRPALSPSLAWHFHLLGQLLAEFYTAKLREQKLQQQSYVQAVHETGARLTHDIKNLLQSLNVLCKAAEHDGEWKQLDALVRRQLPAITERLQQTVDKLQHPSSDSGRLVGARSWWDGLRRGFQNRAVEFSEGEIRDDVELPKELFDSAADNFLQNALRKRHLDGQIRIQVQFRCGDGTELLVRDSGEPVPAEILRDLLTGPVSSEAGYGIGLYQSARLAALCGYAIVLASNVPGDVCFSLRREPRGEAARA